MPRFRRPGKGFLKLVGSGALLALLVTRIEIAGTHAGGVQADGSFLWLCLSDLLRHRRLLTHRSW